jgi:serine/threonine protein phosphatase PrpC
MERGRTETDMRGVISKSAEMLSAEVGEAQVTVKKSTVKNNGKARTPKEKTMDISALTQSTFAEQDDRSEDFALDLLAISDYIADIMAGGEDSYEIDADKTHDLSECLNNRFPSLSLVVSVLGGTRYKVLISCDNYKQLSGYADRITGALESHFGFAMDAREPFEIGGRAYMTLVRRATLDIFFAERRKNASGEMLCGDNIGTSSKSENGQAYAFISDGMGSGADAARASEICAMFLQKLLPINGCSGDSVKNTLGVINGFIRSTNNTSAKECSATVDLGVFDLVEGRASFYKSGAAPTFIFRDGALFKLRARTVPIGIIKEPDLGRINMELLPGDVVIMVSDGVTDGREEYPELFEFLRTRVLTHSADQLADAIISFSEQSGCEDDVSVIVAKVDERVFGNERGRSA